MTAPRCTVCDDTGEVGQRGSLDCRSCNAAETRMRLNAHMAFALHMPVADRDWAVFQYTQSLAAGVVRDYMGPEIHCQEFHELAMDYRSAGTVFDVYSPQHAYERLCAYINERIAPVAAQPSRTALGDELLASIEALQTGCRDPSWIGWQNGDGEEVGTRLQAAIDAYKAAAPLPEAGSAAPAGEVERDAARYRYLRMCDWFSSDLCVLRDPKKALTSGAGLGADCPSRYRLDTFIDAAITATKE